MINFIILREGARQRAYYMGFSRASAYSKHPTPCTCPAAGTSACDCTVIIAPKITTETLPNGVVGTAYSQTLRATGNTPITWSIDTGSLPDGLALSTSGVISGTPATDLSPWVPAAKWRIVTGKESKPLGCRQYAYSPCFNTGAFFILHFSFFFSSPSVTRAS